MDSSTFPSIHSCDFCRTLGIEDEKSHHGIEATPRLLPWPWTRIVEGYEKSVQNTELNKTDAKVQYGVCVLEDYKDNFPGTKRTVFDCTIGRIKQASKAGCFLSTMLLHAFHDPLDDALLLIARCGYSRVDFGLALPIAQTTRQQLQGHQDMKIVRDVSQSFLLAPDPGKFWKHIQ
jgi:hypothetical protein